MKRIPGVLVLVLCLAALPAWAARKEKPTGKEIADKAKAAKLDPANAIIGEKEGKKIKLTPADLSHVKTEAELEDGQMIGVLETEVAGDETPLLPGKYNLFLTKVGNDWHVYAESEGKIVAEAVRVKMEEAKEKKKPEFVPEGWCLAYLIYPCWREGLPAICRWYICF